MRPIDISWIALCILITALIMFSLFGIDFLNPKINFYIQDIFVGITNWVVWILVFLFSTFVLSYLKEFRFSFSRSPQYLIVALSGILLLLFLALILIFQNQFISGGWTAYPPLSGPDMTTIIDNRQNSAFGKIRQWLSITAIGICIMQVYPVYQRSTQKLSRAK
jgi:magnesium-transporting ATPase (P-type)